MGLCNSRESQRLQLRRIKEQELENEKQVNQVSNIESAQDMQDHLAEPVSVERIEAAEENKENVVPPPAVEDVVAQREERQERQATILERRFKVEVDDHTANKYMQVSMHCYWQCIIQSLRQSSVGQVQPSIGPTANKEDHNVVLMQGNFYPKPKEQEW